MIRKLDKHKHIAIFMDGKLVFIAPYSIYLKIHNLAMWQEYTENRFFYGRFLYEKLPNNAIISDKFRKILEVANSDD